MLVDDPRAAATVGDRGDDQRLADARVAGGKDAVRRGREGVRANVAAPVEAESELGDDVARARGA